MNTKVRKKLFNLITTSYNKPTKYQYFNFFVHLYKLSQLLNVIIEKNSPSKSFLINFCLAIQQHFRWIARRPLLGRRWRHLNEAEWKPSSAEPFVLTRLQRRAVKSGVSKYKKGQPIWLTLLYFGAGNETRTPTFYSQVVRLRRYGSSLLFPLG